MTEQQWIARARHGDADAFEQLVVAYEGPVYRLALRMCGSAEDAREVTQDAFLATAASPHGCTGLPPMPPSTSCVGKSTIWGTSRWKRRRSGRIPSSRSFWRSRESSRRPCKGRWIICPQSTGRCCCCGWYSS